MTFLDRVEPIDLVPYVRSLAVEQLSRRSDPWSVRSQAATWEPTDTLDSNGVGLDSFDLITLAGTANRLLMLHEAAIEEYLLVRRRLIDWAELALHAWRRAYEARVGFLTSGSTGERSLVVHSIASLQEEIDAFLGILPPVHRVISYVPAHHIYGFLFTIMMPVAGATPCIHRMNPFSRGLQSNDRIVAHPTIWQSLDEGDALNRGITGTSSTGPLPSAVADRLRERGVRLFEIYGSTETAGVGWRDAPGAYRLLPHWQRADDGTTLRHRDGRVVRLMDRIEWEDDRRFVPTGRVDRQVQVGGHNVSPEAVERRLQEHPFVADAAVRLMNPAEGDRLKAFVVPTEGAPSEPEVRRILSAWAVEMFETPARPAHISVGARLPKNEMGKRADWIIDSSPDSAP